MSTPPNPVRPASPKPLEIRENTLPYFYVSGVGEFEVDDSDLIVGTRQFTVVAAGGICVGVPSIFLNHLECLKNMIQVLLTFC